MASPSEDRILPEPDETRREKIDKDVQSPRRVRGDEGEVEQHPLPDQIEADRYLAQSTASKNPLRGIRLTKLIPPGAV